MTGILVVIVLTNVYMLIAIFLLGLIGYKLAVLYTNAAKDIKRLEGISKWHFNVLYLILLENICSSLVIFDSSQSCILTCQGILRWSGYNSIFIRPTAL